MTTEVTLSPAQEQLLRAQVIDAEHPGPILHDFQTVLDYIGPDGVPAAGKYNLLPLDAIDALDHRLSRPLHLKLTRPLLRSHPYLQGLHLLLRATGLARVEGAGSKARLTREPAVHAAWDGLNPTERYFALLEAWLLVGRPEMIGERSSRFTAESLHDCLLTWHRTRAGGQTFDLKQPASVYFLGIGRAFYHVALMDLFGLMDVARPSTPVKPWCPAGLKPLPFGDAVFTLLNRVDPFGFGDPETLDDLVDLMEEGAAQFGCLQPLFQPYFPAWRNNLILPETPPQEGVFVFRVSLDKMWRLIAIPAGATLDDLANCILDAVNFDNDHLYAFTYRDRFGATVEAMHPFDEEGLSAAEVRIGELPLQPGQSLSWLYDFGDSWRFDIKLERIDPPRPRMKAAKVLERHGKAPKQYPDWD